MLSVEVQTPTDWLLLSINLRPVHIYDVLKLATTKKCQLVKIKTKMYPAESRPYVFAVPLGSFRTRYSCHWKVETGENLQKCFGEEGKDATIMNSMKRRTMLCFSFLTPRSRMKRKAAREKEFNYKEHKNTTDL